MRNWHVPWQPPPFDPIVRNPHLHTILANFWPRKFDFSSYPADERLVQTDPDTQVLVHSQRPPSAARAELVLIHGLEGGANAGYIVSMAHWALSRGFAVHRFHMRTCGGTAHLAQTLYHGGLTSDLQEYLKTLRGGLPVFLIGFSLGGNVALKLAGELGQHAADLMAGVCTISAAIDLGSSARRIGQLDNRLYERRFLKRMRARIVATGRYIEADIARHTSLYAIDDAVTAPSFGFRNADHYYETQSSNRVLSAVAVPTLMLQAQDDTFIPFSMYRNPAIAANPWIRLVAPEHGGHVGFLSRRAPRFWVDQTVVSWVEAVVAGEARSPFPKPQIL